jgi:hypothetical protein
MSDAMDDPMNDAREPLDARLRGPTHDRQAPMHEPPGDTELRAVFERLRVADAAQAPSVQTMLDGARTQASLGQVRGQVRGRVRPIQLRPREWRRIVRVAAPLAAAATLALLLFARSTPDARFRRTVMAYSSDPALGGWRSPTAFLLEVPGHDLLSALPRIGDAALSSPASPAATDRFVPRRDSTTGE